MQIKAEYAWHYIQLRKKQTISNLGREVIAYTEIWTSYWCAYQDSIARGYIFFLFQSTYYITQNHPMKLSASRAEKR